MKDKWDKIILLGVAVLVIAVSVLFALKAFGFSKQFSLTKPPINEDYPPSKDKETDDARRDLAKPGAWRLPNKGTPPKPLPLFRSISIIEMNGKAVDFESPATPPIRPPVTNAWLRENNLRYLDKNVLDFDPDGDGFSNLEEFTDKTNPQNASDHPPYAKKLMLVARRAQIYRLVFAATPDDKTFQIRREATSKWPRKTSFLMEVGQTSRDKQFRLDSYEEKRPMGPNGIPVDKSVLHITYLPTGQKFQLVRKIAENVPTYFAEFQFKLDGEKIIVKKGENFKISKFPETVYRLKEVAENSAVIEYKGEDGLPQTFTVNSK